MNCDKINNIDSLIEKGFGAQEGGLFPSYEAQKRALENSSLQQDITERKVFADRAFYITVIWILFLIILTVLQFFFHKNGWGLSGWSFNIVFSTTTGSVLVFWYLVGKYLFNSKK